MITCKVIRQTNSGIEVKSTKKIRFFGIPIYLKTTTTKRNGKEDTGASSLHS